jgi:hypothetical protein
MVSLEVTRDFAADLAMRVNSERKEIRLLVYDTRRNRVIKEGSELRQICQLGSLAFQHLSNFGPSLALQPLAHCPKK